MAWQAGPARVFTLSIQKRPEKHPSVSAGRLWAARRSLLHRFNTAKCDALGFLAVKPFSLE